MTLPGSGAAIERLIINGPYDEPARHWDVNPASGAFELRAGRRPAGFVRSPEGGSLDDPGIFVPFALANRVRERVRAWRARDYPNAGVVSRRLLRHWRDREERQFPLFFCQLEAIETLIWLSEASPREKYGIAIPADGGSFERVCSKMATGTGKTVVMCMLIAWQVLSKVTNPQDTRYTENILVIGPGLTVKRRLNVLKPGDPENYYDSFHLVPDGLRRLLNAAKVQVEHRHALEPIDPRAGPKVVKKGREGPQAFSRRVLRELAGGTDILVINDEGHHAWRAGAADALDRAQRAAATQWVQSLDRINAARGILRCHDFSATPFVPRGKNATQALVFPWIVSDFGLNDAIESGLVKTPRVVARADAVPNRNTLTPKLGHLYSDKDVFRDLNRGSAKPDEPLPDLITDAYRLLGADWLETKRAWDAAGMPTPPVMISVTNNTQTAARAAHAFASKQIPIDALCDPARLLHIDSGVLKAAEERDGADVAAGNAVADENGGFAPPMSKPQRAEALRQRVNTVGQIGKPGQHIANVISVLMLSEGWDTPTVTHIMGLRAFTSELLCEQVIGRGLRRASYSDFDAQGLLRAEYVNVFGVPFRFLPVEAQSGADPKPPVATKRVEAVPEKSHFALAWPNVVRVDRIVSHDLELDFEKPRTLVIDARASALLVDLAPIVDGQPDLDAIDQLEVERLARAHRLQQVAFGAVRDMFYQEPGAEWRGNEALLMSRIADIALRFVESGKIQIEPARFGVDPLRRRVLIALNFTRVLRHLWKHFLPRSTARYELIFDHRLPIRTTADMNPWYTSKAAHAARRSHVNYAVRGRGWEGEVANLLDQRTAYVDAWVKSDRLGFEIAYVERGAGAIYRPEYLVRMRNGTMLVLDVNGVADEKNTARRDALAQWIHAVNADGRFGTWATDALRAPEELTALLERHAGTDVR